MNTITGTGVVSAEDRGVYTFKYKQSSLRWTRKGIGVRRPESKS